MARVGRVADFDVIVVGGGAAGGILAGLLAEAGKTVLLLERGRRMSVKEVSRDHVRNHRLALYGHNTGPELVGNPRTYEEAGGRVRLLAPNEGAYQNNAMVVGGGTLVYGAQAWRFLPDDFRMASRYGVPEGSSLADWPISYEELEPWYDRAEWGLGVAGDAAAMPRQGARSRPFPMAPHAPSRPQQVLKLGAERLGLSTHAVPLLINTEPYNGRAACIRCGMCVGFACPTDAKNGSQNTLIPRGLATGRLTLVAGAQAGRIECDARGKASGVWYFQAGGKELFASARVVVSSAGAIESARLLLLSRGAGHESGLGNNSNHVGRHLQGHYYHGAHGLFEDVVQDGLGPGPSISTCDFNHGNKGVIGGGMLADEFIKLPIIFNKWGWPPGQRRWGQAAKDFMRHAYSRTMQVHGPVQEIPSPTSRVTLDPDVRDANGLPVVRLSGATHLETARTAEFVREKAVDWLRASGATRIWTGGPIGVYLSAGQHQAGTCRMGRDAGCSVTDATGRVHGTDNVYVVDGGLHVTNGGFNPVLTIMALAYRAAAEIGTRV